VRADLWRRGGGETYIYTYISKQIDILPARAPRPHSAARSAVLGLTLNPLTLNPNLLAAQLNAG